MSFSEVEDDFTSRRLGRDQDPDCDAKMTTKQTSKREDEVKPERSRRQQDRDFQCNDDETSDEDDVISDSDDNVAFEKEDEEMYDGDDEMYDGDDPSDKDDELCSSFGLEHQTPERRPTTAKRCTMRHLPIVCLNRREDESKRKRRWLSELRHLP